MADIKKVTNLETEKTAESGVARRLNTIFGHFKLNHSVKRDQQHSPKIETKKNKLKHR
jgi:hypothetical protein